MAHNHFTENDLKKALARDGLTYSYYRQRIREDLGKMHLVNREIKSKIVIKEEDLRKTYSQNLKGYTDPLEVKVQQIFLPIPQWATEEQITTIRKEAQSVLEKARQGEDFAQLARNHSKGPEASEGGVLGFFKPKELRPELEEAAFRMKPGELSDLVKSPEGFHILRVMERKGGEPKPFAEVQDKIRDEMVQAEGERQFREWMKALRAKAYIEVRLQ
jgi:peptidyl-prolyl cis-trans isomerase SurA